MRPRPGRRARGADHDASSVLALSGPTSTISEGLYRDLPALPPGPPPPCGDVRGCSSFCQKDPHATSIAASLAVEVRRGAVGGRGTTSREPWGGRTSEVLGPATGVLFPLLAPTLRPCISVRWCRLAHDVQ